ncbi:hypothetical protein CPB86DRAFT_605415 [Serendipita vermifera]|nr:hypothetical protein CPB86DRAFT_605415 [Serendipita vermifera]
MDCCPVGDDCVTIGAQKGCCPQVSERCGGSQCCSPGASCCPGAAVGEGCCETGTTCCGNGCCRSPAVCGRDTDTRSLTCMLANVATPLEFDANQNRELAENMCRSMRARGVLGNEEVLTRRLYNSKSEAARIRRKAKCGGVTKCASTFSCDEYPPASTEEGYDGLYGLDVFSCCIDHVQNVAGGRQLSSLYGQGSRALGAGSKFVVRVKNLDCSTVSPADPQVQCGPVRSSSGSVTAPTTPVTKVIGPIEKRQSNQGEANTLYPPLEGDPSSYTLVAFGDLEVGEFK